MDERSKVQALMRTNRITFKPKVQRSALHASLDHSQAHLIELLLIGNILLKVEVLQLRAAASFELRVEVTELLGGSFGVAGELLLKNLFASRLGPMSDAILLHKVR